MRDSSGGVAAGAGGTCAGSKRASLRHARDIDHRAVRAGDADKAVVGLGRIQALDLAAPSALLVGAAGVRHQGVGDLPRAARLGVEQVRLQVVAQEEERENAEQHEHRQ